MRIKRMSLMMLAAVLVVAGCQKPNSNQPAADAPSGVRINRTGFGNTSPPVMQSPSSSQRQQSAMAAEHNNAVAREPMTQGSPSAAKPRAPQTTPTTNGASGGSSPATTSNSTAAVTSSTSATANSQGNSSQGNGKGPAAQQREFTATLSGSHEVPAVTTDAHGEAHFTLGKDGKTLHFEITVHDLKDVTMAHLHIGAADTNGPHVLWLFPANGQKTLVNGMSNGELSSGTITANDFVGKLKGQPFSTLVTQLRKGNVYVNVHTKQNPEGELRGQLH